MCWTQPLPPAQAHLSLVDLTSMQLLGAFRRIVSSVDRVGADIVEVSPPYDGPGAITAEVANRVGLEIISALAKKKSSA